MGRGFWREAVGSFWRRRRQDAARKAMAADVATIPGASYEVHQRGRETTEGVRIEYGSECFDMEFVMPADEQHEAIVREAMINAARDFVRARRGMALVKAVAS